MPVLRSGNFVLYGFQLSDHGALLDGDTQYDPGAGMEGRWGWQNFLTSNIITYPTDVVFFGPEFLDTTTEGTEWPAGAPPPGFTIKTGPFQGPTLVGSIPLICPGPEAGLHGTNAGIGLTGICGAASFQNEDPLLLYITLLTFYKATLTGTPGLVAGGISKTGPWSTPTTGLRITGGYDIIAWWWVLPDKDACGNEHDSHLVLSEEKPDDLYEKLDPEDSDAAPQPVITNVEPNHGRAGTRVAIIGSGFGDGANVQFDGVDAEDIDVISQYRIEATAPAHANGFANIAVINVDGVSS